MNTNFLMIFMFFMYFIYYLFIICLLFFVIFLFFIIWQKYFFFLFSSNQQLDNYEIKPGKCLKINVSVPNLRLFVGNIPKSKGKEEILDEFGKLTGKFLIKNNKIEQNKTNFSTIKKKHQQHFFLLKKLCFMFLNFVNNLYVYVVLPLKKQET